MSLGSRMKSALDVFSTIAVILAAGILIWTLLMKQPGAQARQEQVEQVKGLRIDAARITNTTGNGRIAIVEFSDFQCPFCRRHAIETLPTIMRDLVESGDVRYVAMHYPMEEIHPLALHASEAAECAGRQGRFWEMHSRLFGDANALSELGQHAQALGLDQARFEECLTGQQTLEKVRADQAEGRRLGVKGTPAFFIGTMRPDGGIDLVTRIRGAAPAEMFAQQMAQFESRSRRNNGH